MKLMRVLTLVAELALTLHGDVHPRHEEHKPATVRVRPIAEGN